MYDDLDGWNKPYLEPSMAAQTAVTLTYALSPPEGTNAPPSLAQSSTHAFAVGVDKTANTKTYYEAVQKSISAAREKVGEELTAWRDAVGNAEAVKESTLKAARAEEEEEEEEEE